MLNRKTLTAIALIAAGVNGPVFAEDDDNTAQLLVEEARTYGVYEPTGQSASEVTAQRERRLEAKSEQLNTNEKNEKAWEAIRPKNN